jgi:hypothetical protein
MASMSTLAPGTVAANPESSGATHTLRRQDSTDTGLRLMEASLTAAGFVVDWQLSELVTGWSLHGSTS